MQEQNLTDSNRMHYSCNVNHNCCIILHPFIFILLIKQKKVSVEPAAESDEKKNAGSLMDNIHAQKNYDLYQLSTKISPEPSDG